MRRREFLGVMGGTAAWPLAARAQQRNVMSLIGFVTNGTIERTLRFGIPLTNVGVGLAEQGYVEGKNFRYEFREADDKYDRLPVLFRELVDQKVSVIICDTTVKVQQAKAATQSIPIVFGIGNDPVENGFVASFNRPGGNITGVYNLGNPLVSKRLEILHELLPSATKFAFMVDPTNVSQQKIVIPLVEAAAKARGITLLHVEASNPNEIEAAYETATRGGVEAMLCGPDALCRYTRISRYATDCPRSTFLTGL